jgi:hypothetical protein
MSARRLGFVNGRSGKMRGTISQTSMRRAGAMILHRRLAASGINP